MMSSNEDSQIDIASDYEMIDISQLPPEIQKSIDVSKKTKIADSIKVLVTGKTGSGKTTLVSGLLGVNVDCAQEYHIGKYEVQKDGVTLTVWDSPGLQDGTGNQQEYLRQIEEQCAKRDLTIYCIRMSETRFVFTADNPDVVAMRKLTATFGNYFWKNCIIALTYSNTLQAFDQDWEQISPQEQVKRFQAKVMQWTEQIQDILHREIRVPEEIGKSVKIIPAGHFKRPHLPGINYWLSNFWFQCIDTITSSEVRMALVKVNMSRIKREKEVKNQDFKLPAHEQPIVATKRFIDSIIPVVGAGVAGGAVGGAVFGLLSLITGPGLLVSIPVGVVVGALVGGGATAAGFKFSKN